MKGATDVVTCDSVSCIPDFPPSTPQEKAARATFEAFLDKKEKGGIIEMVRRTCFCVNATY